MIRQFIKNRAVQIGRTIGYIRDLSAYLGPKDDWIEGLRRRILVLLDPAASVLGRPLIREKGGRDYIGTVEATDNEFESAIMPPYQRNLTSTRKYRIIDGERQWADGSFVYDPDDTDWQHHVFIFPEEVGEDGTVKKLAVYGHKEKSAEKDPVGHVSDPQEPGDPDNILKKQLRKHNITLTE